MTRKLSQAPILATAAWLALCAFSLAADYEEETARVVQLSAHGKLSIEHVAGKVDIQGTDEGVARVKIQKRADASSESEGRRALARAKVLFGVVDGVLQVQVVYQPESKWEKAKHALFGAERGRAAVDITVSLPRKCAVAVNTVSGAVNIRDTLGKLQVTGVSGLLTATRVSGPEVLLHSVSGNVDASFKEGFHTAAIETGAADVVVALPFPSGAEISFQSTSGKLRTRPAIPGTTGETSFRGKLGRGGSLLKITTGSGDAQVNLAR